jgi:hypothetical protein
MARPTSILTATPFRIAAICCVLWMYAGILTSGQKLTESPDQSTIPEQATEAVPLTAATPTGKESSTKEMPPREVLLWYVNETSPNDAERANYDTIIEWLESAGTEKTKRYAQGLRDDLTQFPATVAREEAAIETGTIAADGKIDALIVTNRLAREGKYRYYDAAQRQFAEGELAIPPSADYVLASNPLVRSEVLKLVLAEAARRYDPTQHRFVLIAKTHSAPDRALSVGLSRHNEQTTREILLASLDGDPEELPAVIKYGVSKKDFYNALSSAGDGEMQFPLIFLEGCRNSLAAGKDPALPANVELFYTSGKRGLEYSTLDYAALLKQVAGGQPLAEALEQFLKPRFSAFIRPEQPISSKLLWFAPLVLLLLCFGYFKWTQSRERSKPVITAGDASPSITEPAHPSLDAETSVGANPTH